MAFDASQEAAQRIHTEVQARAQTWMDIARATADKDADTAMAVLRRVITLYPRGDARYVEAYKLLKSMMRRAEKASDAPGAGSP